MGKFKSGVLITAIFGITACASVDETQVIELNGWISRTNGATALYEDRCRTGNYRIVSNEAALAAFQHKDPVFVKAALISKPEGVVSVPEYLGQIAVRSAQRLNSAAVVLQPQCADDPVHSPTTTKAVDAAVLTPERDVRDVDERDKIQAADRF